MANRVPKSSVPWLGRRRAGLFWVSQWPRNGKSRMTFVVMVRVYVW